MHRVLAAALILLSVACATTEIQSSWRNPEAGAIRFEKVVAIVLSKDATTRRVAEDRLAQASPSGRVVASHTFLPDSELGDVEAMKLRVQEGGFDGAVVMRAVGKEKRETVVPGAPLPPMGAPHNNLWGFYGMGWSGAYTPGHVQTDTFVDVETMVFSVRDEKLVWAGRSETMNPRSVPALVDEVAAAVRRELVSAGLLPGS